MLFILSGSLRRDEAGWHTTMWGDVSDLPVLGDRLRVEAGALFWRNNPETQIIVSGGCGTLCVHGAPAISSIMKRELVELGIPANAITEESESGTTFVSLRTLRRMIDDGHLTQKDIIIMSNKYHLPRIAAMTGDTPWKLLAAEDVLLEYDPHKWSTLIEAAEQSPRMQEIKDFEARGVEMLKKGTYQLN